jgi:hypothetical protein
MMKSILKLFAFALLLQSSVQSASVQIEWFNEAGDELLTLGGDPLPAGTAQIDDGSILQLGFYTLGTPENPFQGDWREMGEGFIGGKGTDLPGRFDYSNTYGDGIGSPIRPSAETPLVIRFHDSPSLATATYFNAVSNSSGSWNWVEPTDPQIVLMLTLADPGLVWQDGPSSAFRTTIFIPEPSSSALLAFTFPVLLLRRRRSLDDETIQEA